MLLQLRKREEGRFNEANRTLPDVTRHFHPVLRSARLGDKPTRVQVNGYPIVLFRTHDGRAAALKDECPHRHTPLSFGDVVGDRLQCAYHGWTFDNQGEGFAPGQPSLKCGVEAFHAIEKLGYIWVARRSTPVSAMPEFVDAAEHLTGAWAGFERMPVIEMTIQSPLGPVIDNFAEIEHVPYVHKILGWSAADASKMQIQMDNRDDGSDALAWGPQRELPNALLKTIDRILMRRGDTSLLEYGFRFSPVHTIFMPGWGDPVTRERRSFSVRATSVLVPVDGNVTRLINFSFLKIHDARLQRLLPLVKATAWMSLRSELKLDAGICEKQAYGDTESLRHMRLDKHDRQVAHNRKLLERIYYGTGAEPLEAGADEAPAATAERSEGIAS
jgi:nitrite reductase/ring-hydroxylating ferredoxin subunit